MTLNQCLYAQFHFQSQYKHSDVATTNHLFVISHKALINLHSNANNNKRSRWVMVGVCVCCENLSELLEKLKVWRERGLLFYTHSLIIIMTFSKWHDNSIKNSIMLFVEKMNGRNINKLITKTTSKMMLMSIDNVMWMCMICL